MNDETLNPMTETTVGIEKPVRPVDPDNPYSFLHSYDTFKLNNCASFSVDLVSRKKVVTVNALLPDNSVLAPEIAFIIRKDSGNYGYGKDTTLNICERIIEDGGNNYYVDSMGDWHLIYFDSETGEYKVNGMSYVADTTVDEMGLTKTMRYVSSTQSYNWIKSGGSYKGFNKITGFLELVADKNGKYFKINYDSYKRVASVTDWRFAQMAKLSFTYENNLLTKITDTSMQKSITFSYTDEADSLKKLYQVNYAGGVWLRLEYGENDGIGFTTSDNRILGIKGTSENEFTVWEKTSAGNIQGISEPAACSLGDLIIEQECVNWTKYSFAHLSADVEKSDETKTKYKFSPAGYISEKIVYTHGNATAAVKYEMTKNSKGKIDTVTEIQASPSCLNKYAVFNFVDGAKTVTTYKNDLPSKKIVTDNFVTCNRSPNTDFQSKTIFMYNDDGLVTLEQIDSFYVSSASATPARKLSHVKIYNYDENSNLIEEKEHYFDSEGISIKEHEYDACGMLIKTTAYNNKDPFNKLINVYTYDDYHRLSSRTDEIGVTTTYAYAPVSNNVVGITEGGFNTRNFTYDAYGNVITHTCGTQVNTVTYTSGEVTKMSDGAFSVAIAYDFKRRPVSTYFNGQFVDSAAYLDNDKCIVKDAAGNWFDYLYYNSYKKFNYRLKRAGETTYNDLYESELKPDGTVTKEIYDAITSYYSYNELGQLTSFYQYDGDDVIVHRENFLYNDYGQFNNWEIWNAGSGTVNYYYYYDLKNRLTSEKFVSGGKSITVEPSYDRHNRLTGKTLSYSASSSVAPVQVFEEEITYKAGTNLPQKIDYGDDSITYEYDANGNIKKITFWDGEVYEYEYDGYNRLINDCGVEITYDNYGNITKKGTQVYTYTDGKLTSYDGNPIQYDANRNITSYGDFAWEGHQLVEGFGWKHEYDGKGRRISRSEGNYKIKYYYDSQDRLIAQVDEYSTMIFFYDHSGVAGFILDGEPYFYRKDLQGSVIAVLDKTGTVMVRYHYDAWGNHYVFDWDDLTGIGQLNPFRYRSYLYDNETGLYFLGSRVYDPLLARFLSPDDVAYADPTKVDGLNLYAYCCNNPVMYSDPTGHSLIAIFVILGVGLVVGAAAGGIVAANNGKTGLELVKDIIIGASLGLAAAGAFITLGSAVAGAFGAVGIGSGTFLGVQAKMAFTVGALAFDFTAFLVAPIVGFEMQPLELNPAPEKPLPLPTPITAATKSNSKSNDNANAHNYSVLNNHSIYLNKMINL